MLSQMEHERLLELTEAERTAERNIADIEGGLKWYAEGAPSGRLNVDDTQHMLRVWQSRLAQTRSAIACFTMARG
jgi:hypothetical protein